MSEIYIYQDGVCLKVIVSSDFQTYTEIQILQILKVYIWLHDGPVHPRRRVKWRERTSLRPRVA